MSEHYARQAKEMRLKVFSQMLTTRGRKYRGFLRYLRFFKFIAFAPIRGRFLESYYTLMRYLDDVVDGDETLPPGYITEANYIAEKIKFLDQPVHPKDNADYMMLYCFGLAKRFGEDFSEETRDILESLLFDARRRGKHEVFSKEELKRHFHLLDIRGTIRATLRIFKDDPDKYLLLEPLGIACRHQYDLEDFDADVAAGYINIPHEECAHFGIHQDDFCCLSSIPVKSWQRYHAGEGMAMLAEHHLKMPAGNFSILQRAIFKVVYEMPAKRIFRKILSETNKG